MRLGFAVAIHVDPDVLLVDEVLAVGDEGFTHKCLDKFARVPAPRQDDSPRHALARAGRAILRRGAVAGRRRRCTADGRSDGASWAPTSPTSRRARSSSSPPDDARAREAGRRAALAGRSRRGAARRSDRDGRGAGRHVPGDRGPMGIARGGDRRCDASRRDRRAGPRLPVRRAHDRSGSRCRRARADRPTSSSASGSSTPMASAATAPTRTSRS